MRAMDLLGSLLTFGLGAGTIVVAQTVQGWRELKLDQARRADDRMIDRGRTEAQTLTQLQEALNDLRLAIGGLTVAMRAEPEPTAPLEAYSVARSRVDLQAGRVLSDPIRIASEKASLMATFVASTADESGRRPLLADYFAATDAAEALLKPELREQIRAGYLKLE